MRILQLTLSHYRGIDRRTVEPQATGVTIIEGPNEIGKSSLTEALDLLFSEYDSTKKKKWLAVRPNGTSEPTAIEALIESGPYRFRYRKQFFRKPTTRLEVEAPQVERLDGREAHDRANAILRETLDEHLWKGLRVQQGAAIDQPDSFVSSPSLVAALDRSAGGEADGEAELDLFALVEEEYAKYFTAARGYEAKALKRAYLRVEEATTEVDRLVREQAQLDDDIARVESLDREIVELAAERARSRALAERHEARVRELDLEGRELSRLELARRVAAGEASSARRARADREELVARAEEARRERRRLEAAAEREEPELKDLEAQREALRSRREQATDGVARAEVVLGLRDRDVDFRDGELNLEQLTERRDRIVDAESAADAARAVLAETRVDEDALRALREAAADRERAQARLDAGSARLEIRAERDLEIRIDGETLALRADEAVERGVAEAAAVTVPGALELRVVAGASAGELRRARDRAREQLDAALERAGAKDLADAEAQVERAREARRTIEQAARSVKQDLRDLDFETLCGKVENTRRFVERYPRERPAEPPIARSYDAAVTMKREAKEALAVARAEAQEAASGFSATDTAWQEARRRIHERTFRLKSAIERDEAARAKLDLARAEGDDEALAARLAEAERRRHAAERAYSAARLEHEKREPQRVREEAEEARRAEAAAGARLDKARRERDTLQGRLEARGEDGLHESIERARTARAAAERDRTALDRRAAAARLLFETMRDAREAAQRSYAGPLRERIVELGRLVYGHGFDVELDDELRIATRTLDGVTLPFSSLSVGAREQLGLLARLATALTVDERDGVPLILDDTLGYSDAGRLDGMAKVLGKAGERCQVLVLTSSPERFAGVEGAKRIALA